jgi:hypothetical protein
MEPAPFFPRQAMLSATSGFAFFLAACVQGPSDLSHQLVICIPPAYPVLLQEYLILTTHFCCSSDPVTSS